MTSGSVYWSGCVAGGDVGVGVGSANEADGSTG